MQMKPYSDDEAAVSERQFLLSTCETRGSAADPAPAANATSDAENAEWAVCLACGRGTESDSPRLRVGTRPTNGALPRDFLKSHPRSGCGTLPVYQARIG